MSKVFFSSWNGSIHDERNKAYDERIDLKDLKLPGQIDQTNLKALIGWAGLVIVDSEVDIIEALSQYFSNVQNESCGKCIPCRAGSKVIADRLVKVKSGEGTEEDLLIIEELGNLVHEGSLCELGISSPLPLLHALKYFRQEFIDCVKNNRPAKTRGFEYRAILTAPCRNGCPSHINIPKYIECISEGNYEEALAVNREKTPFVGTLGRVCVHPCESNCNRQPIDDALSIRLLKRFAADFGLRTGYDLKYPAKRGSLKPERIAVVGGGPAGINAAYQLALKGYGVTVFEALPVPGGMLAVGIPSYRLPRDILNYEIDLVRKLGVEIICNTRVGVDISLEQIWKDGFKAIFIAGGLHESATMGCEGEDACYFGFMPGVEFLRKLNLGQKIELGETISVIGGGNVAMDCARSAVRLGVKEVNLIYRRTRNEMPANAAEVKAADEEGIKFHLLANPVCILEDSGAVSGMECVQMELGEPDASGRRRPVPLVGSEFEIKADTVIPAIGQVADFSFITEGDGLEVNKWGTLVTNPDTMATPVPGIFAGGDAVLGARTVIEAIATANRAAEAIDSYIREGKSKVGSSVFMERFIESTGVYNAEAVPEMVGARERLDEAVLPVKERVAGFEEADLGFQCPSEVVNEAERCVKCLRLGLAVL
jgi:formate dehydrogenase (NADP+) beta subunit